MSDPSRDRVGLPFDVADRIAAVLDVDPKRVGINFKDHRITIGVPDALRLVELAEARIPSEDR